MRLPRGHWVDSSEEKKLDQYAGAIRVVWKQCVRGS